jgi:hypothetical protein
MARFKVYGAREDSGEDAIEQVEANDADEAEAIARHRGLLVRRVVELEGPEPSPSSTAVYVSGGRATQTIEATGKLWKAVQLLGALSAIAGAVAMVVGFNQGGAGGENPAAIGILLLLAGLLAFLVGRIGGWWFHG